MYLLQNIINLDSITLSQDLNCVSQEDFAYHIFIKDKAGKYLNCNDATAHTAGLRKHNDLLKATDFDLCWANYADIFRANDEMVMKTEKQEISIEYGCDFNNNFFKVTSFKSPLRSQLQSKKIIGVVGFSIIHKKSLYNLSDNLYYSALTSRERACLLHLIKGKTAQQIADIFHISKRTVEKHIANIKDKLNCKTKSDLIDKAISNGFVNFNLFVR